MTVKDDELEARIEALERAMSFNTNPGGFSRAEAVTLKEFFENLFRAQDREITALKELIFARFAAIDTALAKTAEDIKDRFATVNEFRKTLSDQAATFVTKDKLDTMHETSRLRIETLERERARTEGKASAASVYVAYAVAGISIILNIINLLK